MQQMTAEMRNKQGIMDASLKEMTDSNQEKADDNL
jgi:hypothetical protein